MRSHRRLTRGALLTIALLPILGACGNAQQTYVNSEKGQELQFISGSHVRFVGYRGDREWSYTAQRDSQGRITALEMTNPQVGSLRLRARDDGCLFHPGSHGQIGLLCPR